MNPLHIDFAPPGIRREIASMRPLGWLLGAVGLALCIGSIVAFSDQMQQQEAQQAEVERLQSQLRARAAPLSGAASATRSMNAKKSAISVSQAGAVNGAIRQLNLPWSSLLDAIELATPESIALLELAPDAKRHLVKGVAEAKNADMMIDYIRRLKQQEFFGNVVLTRHETSEQDSNRPLRFEFEAEWRQVR